VRSPRSRNSAASPPSRTSLDPGQEVAEPSESSDLPEYIVQEVISYTLKTATSLETLWEEVRITPALAVLLVSSQLHFMRTQSKISQCSISFAERRSSANSYCMCRLSLQQQSDISPISSSNLAVTRHAAAAAMLSSQGWLQL
jgi:hypothetical protein